MQRGLASAIAYRNPELRQIRLETQKSLHPESLVSFRPAKSTLHLQSSHKTKILSSIYIRIVPIEPNGPTATP